MKNSFVLIASSLLSLCGSMAEAQSPAPSPPSGPLRTLVIGPGSGGIGGGLGPGTGGGGGITTHEQPPLRTEAFIPMQQFNAAREQFQLPQQVQ